MACWLLAVIILHLKVSLVQKLFRPMLTSPSFPCAPEWATGRPAETEGQCYLLRFRILPEETQQGCEQHAVDERL